MPTMTKFHMTPRDVQYFYELEEVMVMPIKVAHRRHWKGDKTMKSCLRRHRHYRAHKLINVVTITACFGPRSQRDDMVYLSEGGAAWLEYKMARPVRRLLRTDPSPHTIQHRGLLSQAILSINDAAAPYGTPPTWILEYDRYATAACDLPIPLQYVLPEDFLPVPTADDRPTERYGAPRYDDPTITLVKARPDAACLLPIPGKNAAYAFYLELDNGTETIGQLLAKLPGLHALLTTDTYRRHWPEHRDLALHPRVLFLFTSDKRLENVRQRLLKNPTVLWRRPPRYKRTDDDAARALAFLNTHIRFAHLDKILGTPHPLTTTLWLTLTGEQKVIFHARVSCPDRC